MTGDPKEHRSRSVLPGVGVDIDGVLGNQVAGVLARANAQYGLAVAYEDVTHWDRPLGPSSFVPEIKRAMLDPEYVLNMPVHDGAAEMLSALRERYRVVLLTVRPPEAAVHTISWLRANSLEYDDVQLTEAARKSEHGVALLVDDFPGNVAEFLSSTSGNAILVNQPWNRDPALLSSLSTDARLHRVTALRNVAPLVERLLPRS